MIPRAAPVTKSGAAVVLNTRSRSCAWVPPWERRVLWLIGDRDSQVVPGMRPVGSPEPSPAPSLPYMMGCGEIEHLLESGAEAALVGESETDHLDFKEQPYRLNTDREKWELAKDVAALANAGGRCLVIGIATTTPGEREEEIASEIKPFPAPLGDIKRHRDAIDATAGVYPVLRNIRIHKYSRPDNKALMLIRVPPQQEDDLPFMVIRMVEGDEKRGVGIGVPFRSGAHTFWEPPGQLHRDLSDGRRLRRVGASLPPTAVPTSQPHAQSLEDLSRERLTSIEQYMGWTEAPTLLLAAVPKLRQRIPIEGFFDPDKIRGCVQSPPEIRWAGFSLAWPRDPENVDGALVNATPDRNVLWVEPDGTCFAAATGAQSFLTRSGGTRVAQEPEPRAINPTVLVEWTYLFCLFVRECLADAVEGEWRLVARLRGSLSRRWPLQLRSGLSSDGWEEGSPAGLDDWYYESDATLDPAADAFTLLAQIYALFGLPQEHIPYTEAARVDPEKIKAIR